METTDLTPAPASRTASNAASATPSSPIPASSSPALPALAAGWQSSEFLLSLVVLTAVCSALWAGKIDPASASLLIGLIASAYPSLRTWLKARHLDTLAQALAAQSGPHAGAFAALATGFAQIDGTNGINAPNGNTAATPAGATPITTNSASPANPATSAAASLALLALIVVGALACGGCANAPYYVSGVNVGVTTGPGDQSITGGTIGVTLAPTPNHPAPARSGTSGLKAVPLGAGSSPAPTDPAPQT